MSTPLRRLLMSRAFTCSAAVAGRLPYAPLPATAPRASNSPSAHASPVSRSSHVCIREAIHAATTHILSFCGAEGHRTDTIVARVQDDELFQHALPIAGVESISAFLSSDGDGESSLPKDCQAALDAAAGHQRLASLHRHRNTTTERSDTTLRTATDATATQCDHERRDDQFATRVDDDERTLAIALVALSVSEYLLRQALLASTTPAAANGILQSVLQSTTLRDLCHEKSLPGLPSLLWAVWGDAKGMHLRNVLWHGFVLPPSWADPTAEGGDLSGPALASPHDDDEQRREVEILRGCCLASLVILNAVHRLYKETSPNNPVKDRGDRDDVPSPSPMPANKVPPLWASLHGFQSPADTPKTVEENVATCSSECGDVGARFVHLALLSVRTEATLRRTHALAVAAHNMINSPRPSGDHSSNANVIESLSDAHAFACDGYQFYTMADLLSITHIPVSARIVDAPQIPDGAAKHLTPAMPGGPPIAEASTEAPRAAVIPQRKVLNPTLSAVAFHSFECEEKDKAPSTLLLAEFAEAFHALRWLHLAPAPFGPQLRDTLAHGRFDETTELVASADGLVSRCHKDLASLVEVVQSLEVVVREAHLPGSDKFIADSAKPTCETIEMMNFMRTFTEAGDSYVEATSRCILGASIPMALSSEAKVLAPGGCEHIEECSESVADGRCLKSDGTFAPDTDRVSLPNDLSVAEVSVILRECLINWGLAEASRKPKTKSDESSLKCDDDSRIHATLGGVQALRSSKSVPIAVIDVVCARAVNILHATETIKRAPATEHSVTALAVALGSPLPTKSNSGRQKLPSNSGEPANAIRQSVVGQDMTLPWRGLKKAAQITDAVTAYHCRYRLLVAELEAKISDRSARSSHRRQYSTLSSMSPVVDPLSQATVQVAVAAGARASMYQRCPSGSGGTCVVPPALIPKKLESTKGEEGEHHTMTPRHADEYVGSTVRALRAVMDPAVEAALLKLQAVPNLLAGLPLLVHLVHLLLGGS